MKLTDKKIIAVQFLILIVIMTSLVFEKPPLSSDYTYELFGVIIGSLIATLGIRWMKKKT